MSLGAPILTNHGGILVPRWTTVGAFSPDGQVLWSLDGSGVATKYNDYSQSGNVVTAGGPGVLSGTLEPTRRFIYVPVATPEFWSWDGQTGIAQRFVATSGARITTGGSFFFPASDTTHLLGVQTGDYQLCAGTDIACVTTA